MAELRSVIGYRTSMAALVAGVFAAILVTLVPAPAQARRAGIAAGGCDGCHNGGKIPTVTLTASPLNPTVGQAVTLTVSVSQTNGPVAGFYLTTDDLNKGTFRAIEAGTFASAFGVTHTTPRTGSGGFTTFKVEWSVNQATGANFSVYALSGNGDGTTRGDMGGNGTLGLVVGCTGATYYLDQDGDGVGTNNPAYPTKKDCTKPVGYAAVTGDCDDFTAAIHPGAAEQCDGKDNNCDGKIDEAIVYQPYCEDKDGDGHGITTGAMKSDCAPSMGYGDCKGDCNDFSNTVYPGATEICDGRDNNCNGMTDEGVRMACGVGWCRRLAEGCSTSCTPGLPEVETCNYFDDDCDGMIDNGTDAALCGASGMVCVLGKCMPDEGGGSSGGSGGSGGMTGAGGATSGGGGRGIGNGGAGAGATGTGGPGSGGTGASSGGDPAGGCAVTPAGPEPSAMALILSAVALALALRRVPAGARRRPR